MEYVDLKTASDSLRIPILRKQMKNVRLRVYPNGDVKISAPFGVSYEWINQYVYEKKGWIDKRRLEYKQTRGIEATVRIVNGSTIKLFGKDYYATIVYADQKKIEINENSIIIHITKSNDQAIISEQLEAWLRKKLEVQIDFYLDKLYSIIRKYGH